MTKKKFDSDIFNLSKIYVGIETAREGIGYLSEDMISETERRELLAAVRVLSDKCDILRKRCKDED